MRYNIGQKVVVVHHVLNGRIGWSNPMYRPWEDTLDRIMMETLTVVEHHRVAWDQDPNQQPTGDGYVLEDRMHQRWSNQYPKASYGQTTTAADYYFDRLYPAGTDFNLLSDEQLATFEDVTCVIDRIDRGIEHFSKAEQSSTSHALKYRQMLETYRQQLIDMVKQKTGAEIGHEVIWEDVPDIKRAVLTWP